jgi:LPPG:FO 2-phospho-L-lactate transferase
MADEEVATMVQTPEGWLAFQDYFVRRHHQDHVLAVRIDGIEQARMTHGVDRALAEAELIVFCPSNPIVSIGPILAVPGLRDALSASRAPKVAVSPIVGGKALRGPADTMLAALGHESSAIGVARLYQGLVDGIVIDEQDADQERDLRELGMRVLVTGTIMRTIEDRRRLATTILDWCQGLR